MPFEHRLDVARRLVLTRAYGVLDAADLREGLRTLLELPGIRPEFDQLVDLTEVEDIRVNPSEVADLARVQPFSPTSYRAFVAPADAMFGMTRMYQMLSAEEERVHVARTEAAASSWLEERRSGEGV